MTNFYNDIDKYIESHESFSTTGLFGHMVGLGYELSEGDEMRIRKYLRLKVKAQELTSERRGVENYYYNL